MLAVDAILVWFFSLMAGLTLWFCESLPRFYSLLALYVFCALLGFALPWLSRAWTPSRQLILRAGVCIFLVPIAFLSLALLLPQVSPDDRSWQLLNWDRRLLGADLVRTAGTWRLPVLTDFLVVAYSSYYFLPMILGFALARIGKWKEFEHVIVVVVFGFLLSYLCYFFFPARSPYLLFPELDLQQGLLGAAFQKFVVHAGLFKWEAFPSGHTALTLVVLSLAWRFDRRVFWLLFPLALGVLASTVILGYHYVVDVIAGLGLAISILAIERFLVPKWKTAKTV